MPDSPHRDPVQEFADRIIAELEKGVKPWVRPWDPEKSGGPQAPFNPATGKRYHGINVLIVHFIGAAPDSADWMAMLRRLLGEFQRRFGIQIELADQPDTLRMAFANALHMVAARGRMVLVLDALNQIEDRDGAPDLVWLPPVIPANVRLIVSTLSGRPLDDLHKRAWPVLTVEPLKPAEREMLIVEYLKQYAKQLSAQHVGRIAAAPQSANGLYLTTLLNELRLFGSHEELDRRIGWYLEASDPLELYGKVIQRWERDYEERGPESEDIVGESLTRLWAARRGLSEAELLESLGTDGSPLPRAVWSPLFLAAADSLVNRGGLRTFAHDFLRGAVLEAYLPTLKHQQQAHYTLAAYFDRQPQGPRQLDELPWQWQEAGEWAKLAALLARSGFFDVLWRKDQLEVKIYWTRIESESSLRMEHAYTAIIEQPSQEPEHARRIGLLLGETGKPKVALRVTAQLLEYYRAKGDHANLSDAMGNQAYMLYALGDRDGAMTLLRGAERLCRELGDKNRLQTLLTNQAVHLRELHDMDGAMMLLKEAELICRERGDKDGLRGILYNQSFVFLFRAAIPPAPWP